MLPVSLLSLPGTLGSSLLDCKLHEGRTLSSLASPPYVSIYQVHYLTHSWYLMQGCGVTNSLCSLWSPPTSCGPGREPRPAGGTLDSRGVSPPAPVGGHLLDEHISLAFSKVLHGSVDRSPSPKASIWCSVHACHSTQDCCSIACTLCRSRTTSK